MDLIAPERVRAAFSEGVIWRYLAETTLAKLTHSYSPERRHSLFGKGKFPGEIISFDAIKIALDGVKERVSKAYLDLRGQPINFLNLGQDADAVRNEFYADPAFKLAFDELGIPWDEHRKVNLPWWNEIGCGELEHTLLEQSVAHALFAPLHTYETQLAKAGVPMPVKGVSTNGLLFTRREEGAPQGYLVLGVRAKQGLSFPNTIHIVPAGYLQATPAFQAGTSTLYENFKRDELRPETGVMDEDIAHARPFARVRDFIISNGGPEYVFMVQTNLTQENIIDRWKHSRTSDKEEHSELLFVDAQPTAVREFLAKHYRGAVENKRGRTDDERFILHPAALALAAHARIAPAELKTWYNGTLN